MRYPLFALLICFLISCGDDCPDGSQDCGPETMVDLAELRQNIAIHLTSNLIVPAYQELSEKAVVLNQAASTFSADSNDENLAALRTAHQTFWNCWQKTSLYYFGPIINNGLRATINTYPADEDKIETNIATGVYELGSLGNQDAEGLPALDYILNNVEEITPLDEFTQERLSYISALTNEMLDQVQNAEEDWNNGSFVNNFTGTDATGTDVGSALGLMINGVDLHFQRFVRDGKVAIPAGIRSAGVTRPQSVEVRYGKYSTSLLLTSLKAYQDYFNGISVTRNNGPSILEYLRQINQPVLANQIDNNFTVLIDKVELLDASIAEQIEIDNEALIEVFLSMQDLVAIFKSDMASVMGISITNQDNDGD